MKDEEYVFYQDAREKKNIGRSYYNRKTHAGKSGSVRFPHDNLTRKELQSMSGEAKTYKMNSPMSWNEFKEMPDDLKTTYIKSLRKKFSVPNIEIVNMFGVTKATVYREFKRLGGLELGAGANHEKWTQKAEWFEWLGVETETQEASSEANEEQEVENAVENERICPANTGETFVIKDKADVIPMSGTMSFKCAANQALEMVEKILGDRVMTISITWDEDIPEGA